MNRDELHRHIRRGEIGTWERQGVMDNRRYQEYHCRHCDESFKHSEDSIGGKSSMFNTVERHLEEEHPDVLERDPYPNEDLFREWAETNGFSINAPGDDRSPVVAIVATMKQAKLHPDGTVMLEQHKHLGKDVELHGSRLVVEGDRGDRHRISLREFPIE